MSSERSPFAGGSSWHLKALETAEVAKRDHARVGRLPTQINYTARTRSGLFLPGGGFRSFFRCDDFDITNLDAGAGVFAASSHGH